MRMHLLLAVSALAGLLLQVPTSGTAGQVDPSFAEFIAIQPGEFTMGCNAYPAVQTVPVDGECYDPYKTSGWQDSSPEHSVRITQPFEIGKYEVTQRQWESVMGSNPSHFLDPNHPVESITWFDVQVFLEKLNASPGSYVYRLPTEAEWEYVARAGSSNGTATTGSFQTLKSDAHGHSFGPISPIQVSGPPQGDLDELPGILAIPEEVHIQSERRRPMRGGCTTCLATSRNTSRTYTNPISTALIQRWIR